MPSGTLIAGRLLDVKSSGYTLLHKPVPPAKLRSLMQYLTRERTLVQESGAS